jgi:hypothetical protein
MGFISAHLFTTGVIVIAALWLFPIAFMIVIMYVLSTVISVMSSSRSSLDAR